MTLRRLLPVVLAAAIVLPATVRAQDTTRSVRIGLTYASGTRPGVFVSPVSGTHADTIRAILSRDLDYGDRVSVIAPDGGDPPAGVINYGLFGQIGAAALVQASMTPAGLLHVVLHDVSAARVINVADFPMPGPALGPEWRMAVHAASDEVEYWITGQRGLSATRILFVRNQKMWSVDYDGANAAVVPGLGAALSPAWHPSGRYVAYCEMAADGTHIVLRDLVAGTSRQVARVGGTNISPVFSPDGKTLVFAGGEDGIDLFSAPVVGNDPPIRVTVGRGSQNMSPTFSPDSRRVAFTSNRLGHAEVYITDVDGTNVDLLTTTVTERNPYRSNPDWSHDGRRIAYQAQADGGFQVMTISLRDRLTSQLTSDGINEDPSWGPDDRHMVFTSNRSGENQIWVLDTETFRSRQLTRVGSARMSSWSPRLVSPKQ